MGVVLVDRDVERYAVSRSERERRREVEGEVGRPQPPMLQRLQVLVRPLPYPVYPALEFDQALAQSMAESDDDPELDDDATDESVTPR
ncbi:hypothetical protein ACCS54_18890 [Rhizobium johnstonii]|uniref:hypothetical protein n=1 Tax=Rhizobium johnstonii TaxID=3019933 RepID=UPI003F9E0980